MDRTNRQADIVRTLGTDRPPGRRARFRVLWILLLLVLFGVGTAAWALRMSRTSDRVQYRTQEVRRGDLNIVVTATGNLEPTNQVDVGSELSGTVRSVEVDENDHVKAGSALARLDTSKLEAQVLQSRAALESTRAQVLQAQATVREAEGNLARLRKVRELSGKRVPSQYDLDAAEASLDRARANLAGAEAEVSKAGAALKAVETDLSKAVIRSPINGIVLLRNIEPGQTVASSLQAPVLFTLAEDLTRMELHVDVDEADVGWVQEGQEALFTVDAYPDRTFRASIIRVRYGSETTANVVTYKTVLKVDNRDLSLRPGMTATADISVKKVENSVLIPNAALRFTPRQKATGTRGRGLIGALLPGPPARETRKDIGNNKDKGRQRVWILRNGSPVPVSVSVGATDGTMSVLTSGEIKPGTALIIG